MRGVSRPKRWHIGLSVTVAMLVVAACGAGGSAGTTVPTDTSPPSPDDLRVFCGNVDLGTPAAMELPDTPLDDEATAVLNEVEQEIGEELASLYTWTIAESSDSRLVLFGTAKEPELAEIPYADAVFTNDGSGWKFASLGQCRITVNAPGFGPARVVLNPDSEPDPESSELDVWIQELACANGQAPTDRDIIPVVVEDEQRIVITVLVEPVEGDATCPGNPWHPVTVTLEEPLGNRQILDGVTVPPQPLDWPPSQQDLAL